MIESVSGAKYQQRFAEAHMSQTLEYQATPVIAVNDRCESATDGLAPIFFDDEHRRHIVMLKEMFPSRAAEGRLESWISEHGFKRALFVDYRAGRITGRVSNKQRLQYEHAIRNTYESWARVRDSYPARLYSD